jgi:hypothetical protein
LYGQSRAGKRRLAERAYAPCVPHQLFVRGPFLSGSFDPKLRKPFKKGQAWARGGPTSWHQLAQLHTPHSTSWPMHGRSLGAAMTNQLVNGSSGPHFGARGGEIEIQKQCRPGWLAGRCAGRVSECAGGLWPHASAGRRASLESSACLARLDGSNRAVTVGGNRRSNRRCRRQRAGHHAHAHTRMPLKQRKK